MWIDLFSRSVRVSIYKSTQTCPATVLLQPESTIPRPIVCPIKAYRASISLSLNKVIFSVSGPESSQNVTGPRPEGRLVPRARKCAFLT